MTLKAKWIWKPQDSYLSYNQTIVARKNVTLKAVKQAFVQIAADSYYRLYINNCWINDGPCRSWPEHFQYDSIEVLKFLKKGGNEIKIIARYYGVGDFHRICKQAGLLFQMDVELHSGSQTTIISDETWEVADAAAWISNTPKISIQMEPFEFYDARQEENLIFVKAHVLYDAYNGPWKDLKPRNVVLLSKKPVSIRSFLGVSIVRSEGVNYCLPAARLLFPGLVEANLKVCPACGMATILKIDNESCFDLYAEGLIFTIDGRHNPNGNYKLKAGCHLILALAEAGYSHIKDKTFRFVNPPKSELQNPVNKNEKNPWCFIRFDDYAFAGDDIIWPDFIGEDKDACLAFQRYKELTEKLLKDVIDEKTFDENLNDRAECLAVEDMFVQDDFWRFKERRVISDRAECVINPEALLDDDQVCTIVNPNTEGDVELLYDLGEQNCGYYSFDLTAEEGVRIDINEVEYIDSNGNVQHTDDNRNGMCYITQSGRNSYLSLKRRSGRYIFITIRNRKSPVHIRNVKLIESTYPTENKGYFCCSDSNLNKIWDISARTLKLSMEDTFTDCSVYEQTLWVGDARNESLFAYPVFGATDIAKRSILLAGQSLERYPMVGCQVPSSWNCIIPVWSFLWGISVWEYYWHTGDEGFLEEIWPLVIKNLKGAEQYIDQQGLFSASFWNLFDWAPIDQQQKTVLHNSMFFVGAVDAAIRCDEIVGDDTYKVWLKKLRHKLCRGINQWWDCSKKAYPDSIHDDGKVSSSVSQHTSFLSILYDIIKKPDRADAISNMISPPTDMVRVGSPFAMMYLYEAMERVGLESKIIESIRDNYLPMVQAGATTVWETFLGTRPMPDGPTRSHCHGWSAASVYFLGRIILGIKVTSPGGKEVSISPRIIDGLIGAKGTVAVSSGGINVSWHINDSALNIKYSVPEDVHPVFQKNKTYEGMKTYVNGVRIYTLEGKKLAPGKI